MGAAERLAFVHRRAARLAGSPLFIRRKLQEDWSTGYSSNDPCRKTRKGKGTVWGKQGDRKDSYVL